MKKHILGAALALAAVSSAQANDAARTAVTALNVATPFIAAELVGSSVVPLVGTKTWVFPWANGNHFLSPLGPNGGVTQGVHATSQYVHNVLDPKYFGETLKLDPKGVLKNHSGQHSTSAKYRTSGSSNKVAGQVAVGCIGGMAVSLIVVANLKASALGNPPRWRSQAEHEAIVRSGVERQYELTNDEAQTAIFGCGLGGFMVASNYVARPR